MTIPALIPRSVLFGNPSRLGPTLSPSGDRVAYLAPYDGVLNIWVRSTRATDDTPVTMLRDRPIQGFMWSPDDRRLLYIHDDGDENTHLYQVDPDSGTTLDLTPVDGVQARIIGVSPTFADDLLLALNIRDRRVHDAYRVDLSSGRRRLVAENHQGFVSWIADTRLRIRGATRTADDGGVEILVRDSDGAPWRVVHTGTYDDTVADRPVGFSADGSALHLLSAVDAPTRRLLRLDLRTGDRTVVYADPRYDVVGVDLDPHTREPRMVTVERERRHLEPLEEAIAADLETLRGVRRGDITVVGGDHKDRTWLLQYNVDDAPAAFYLYDRAAREVTFLFSHQPELERYLLARVEPFSFTARDGLPVHGYLTFPPGVPRRRLPAVLAVHGGPWQRDHWGCRAESQWLANRGYLCVQVNFRGSSGYGKEFLNAGDREWGGRMQDDLVDAVRWVIDRGYADPARVGVYGSSYGGYAALLGATDTPDLFRCAIAAAGPSDLRTFVSSIPAYWKPQVTRLHRRVGDPVADADFLWARSPLARVDRIRIPVLVAHGALDPRVRQEEAEKVVAAMRAKGVPHEYMLFPDEGHGLARPHNRLAFYTRAEDFLARHLGGRNEPPDAE